MRLNIYNYLNYKEFIRDWSAQLPKGGHGFYRKMALQLGVSTTLMSQIFNGDKNISLELGMAVASFIGLSEMETEFFLELIELEKAGSQDLKKILLKKIKRIQDERQKLEKRVLKDIELDNTTKSIYYSNWIYTAIRNLISIEEFSNLDKLSTHLNIPLSKLNEIIEFLVKYGFCTIQSGKLKVGPQKTFISKDSPWSQQHHQNWRIKAIEKMPLKNSQNLFFTAPMSMSQSVAAEVREELLKTIEKTYALVGPSNSEVVNCLNIDWFKY